MMGHANEVSIKFNALILNYCYTNLCETACYTSNHFTEKYPGPSLGNLGSSTDLDIHTFNGVLVTTCKN